MQFKNYSPNLKDGMAVWLAWLLVVSLVVLVLDLPKPRQAAHAATNLLIFWDGAAAPDGWTVVSDDAPDPFYHKFIRGSDAYDATIIVGETHTHTISWVSSAIGGEMVFPNDSGSDLGATDHEHNSLGSSSMDVGSHLPTYRELQVISCDAGTSCDVPDDGIAIFDDTPTAGTWTRYSAQDDKFIRGGADGEATSGAATHTHTNVSVTTEGPSSCTGAVGSSLEVVSGNSAHTHTGSDTTAAADHTPPNIDVLLYQNTSGGDQSVPSGMIAMFNGAPGSGWDVISDSGEAFYQKHLEAKSSYAASGGGSATHTHDNLAITTGGPSTTSNGSMDMPVAEVTLDSGVADHIHVITVSFGNADNLPPTVDVIVAKKEAAAYTPATRNWRWFDAEDTADPNTTNGGETTAGHALANEDTTPTNTRIAYTLNAVKIRIVVGETGGAEGTDVKYKLQYDVSGEFGSATDVGPAAGVGAMWRYYDGDNVDDDDTISTVRLSGSPTAGRHNEDASTGEGEGSTFDPAASTDYEHEFTLQNYNALANTVFYFRIQYTENSQAGASWATVSLGSGEAYPTLKTSAAYDLETYMVPATVSLGSYTMGGGNSKQYVFQAGEETVFWDKRGSAPGVTVTVNAFSMGCADPEDTLPGTDITWTSAAGSLGSSFASDPTGATGNNGQTMESNRSAYSLGASADKTVRTGGFYFLPTMDLANLDSRRACNYTGTLQITIA